MFLPMETASAMVQAEAARVDTTSSALLFGSLSGSDLPFPQQLQVRTAKLRKTESMRCGHPDDLPHPTGHATGARHEISARMCSQTEIYLTGIDTLFSSLQ